LPNESGTKKSFDASIRWGAGGGGEGECGGDILLSGDMHGKIKKWNLRGRTTRKSGRGGGVGGKVSGGGVGGEWLYGGSASGYWDEADYTWDAHLGPVIEKKRKIK
jgi:hypothetical protein